MEVIKPGKYVELGYDLYSIDANGHETLMHQTDAEDPESFVFGVTRGLINPLEKDLDGKAQGDEFDVVAKPAEAFGEYDPEQVATLEKGIFMVDGKFDSEFIKPGAYVPMMTAEGFHITGLVKEVTGETVIMDFNHPLAGKGVRLKGKVLTVRDATPEELQPSHGCGCGCGHDHGDCDCNDDDCGCNEGHDHCGCGDGCCH